MESMGPIKISEVEKAQKKAVNICRRLEEEGKLVIGGSTEDQYV